VRRRFAFVEEPVDESTPFVRLEPNDQVTGTRVA
jgi:hypothetical protein